LKKWSQPKTLPCQSSHHSNWVSSRVQKNVAKVFFWLCFMVYRLSVANHAHPGLGGNPFPRMGDGCEYFTRFIVFASRFAFCAKNLSEFGKSGPKGNCFILWLSGLRTAFVCRFLCQVDSVSFENFVVTNKPTHEPIYFAFPVIF
jgi:hypothetical protein